MRIEIKDEEIIAMNTIVKAMNSLSWSWKVQHRVITWLVCRFMPDYYLAKRT